MSSLAEALASWAIELDPTADDLPLARRALLDTIAVAYAARQHPVRPRLAALGEAGGWPALAHGLDFDDLHPRSTAHISAVRVPAALARGGDRPASPARA